MEMSDHIPAGGFGHTSDSEIIEGPGSSSEKKRSRIQPQDVQRNYQEIVDEKQDLMAEIDSFLYDMREAFQRYNIAEQERVGRMNESLIQSIIERMNPFRNDFEESSLSFRLHETVQEWILKEQLIKNEVDQLQRLLHGEFVEEEGDPCDELNRNEKFAEPA